MVQPTSRLAQFRKTIKTQPPDRVVRSIARGYRLSAYTVTSFSDEVASDVAYLQRLVDAGLVAAVLPLLERGENGTVAEALGREESLGDPAGWIMLLDSMLQNTTCEDVRLNTRLEIARRIGLLIRCMIDDRQRRCFDDNFHWWDSMVPFVALLETLTLSLETVPILLQYDGLVEFLIQCMFWESHRPDLVHEVREYADKLDSDIFEAIYIAATRVVRAFAVETVDVTSDSSFRVPERSRKRLAMIASTKIVNEKYNPKCKVTFGAGWFDLLVSAPKEDERESLWIIFVYMMRAQCATKTIFVRTVEHGLANVNVDMDAYFVVEALDGALAPRFGAQGMEWKPKDDHFSIAIKAGFIEMCLEMIVRFKTRSTRDLSYGRMLDYLDNLLNGTGAVSLLKHSAKAVSEHRSDIQEALRSAVGKTEGRCSELVEKVRSIISINIEMRKNTDSHGLDYVLCGRCLVELQADHIKMCSKCHFGRLPFRLCVDI